MFGNGIGTFFLDEVQCNGMEAGLLDCTSSSTVSCTGSQAGVRCLGKL